NNGVTQEGVSAFPQEVTGQMVTNFLSGGSAINSLSRSIKSKLKIIDIGVAANIDENDSELVSKKVRYGTANFYLENAMTKEETLRAMEVGMEETLKMIKHEGIRCLIPGEMGIGNTTTSSASLSVLTGSSVDNVTDRGTGIDSDKAKHKRHIIKQALQHRKPNPNDPIDVLSKVGGLDIAGITGAIITAANNRIPILLDGLISTTAALVSQQINTNIADYLIVGHRSSEIGHDIAIQYLHKQPLLDLDMRLGEGSGAALAF